MAKLMEVFRHHAVEATRPGPFWVTVDLGFAGSTASEQYQDIGTAIAGG